MSTEGESMSTEGESMSTEGKSMSAEGETHQVFKRFSDYVYAPFCRVCLGCCAVECGSSGGTYELPWIIFIFSLSILKFKENTQIRTEYSNKNLSVHFLSFTIFCTENIILKPRICEQMST
jgi:hypothetical protein